ncbi:unnamed protein product, partial [Peniophora sp. CBMAI 1063]
MITKLVLALSTFSLAGASQWPPIFDGLLPFANESVILDTDDYAHIPHPFLPDHGARIKRVDWCDHTVNTYTGYFDLGARHLFFYFFESRCNLDTDDVVLFTHGGPGCSSSLGLLFEHGPCRVTDAAAGPEPFAYSWNNAANVLFLDQPVHTGFSYAEDGEEANTTEEAAVDVAKAVFLFFGAYMLLWTKEAFHIAGISYGGRYVPIFASAIHDQNPALISREQTPINLNSIILGNGNTDMNALRQGSYELVCTSKASTELVIPIMDCVPMKQEVKECRRQMTEFCEDRFDLEPCKAAFDRCDQAVMGPLLKTGLTANEETIDHDAHG